MKLYAKIKAGRGGREAVKGDDLELITSLSHQNKHVYQVEYRSIGANCYQLQIWKNTTLIFKDDNIK